MTFDINKEDIKRAAKCPPGMYLATLKGIEDSYLNDKGTEIEKAEFETADGYTVPYWFNNKMVSSVIEFICAADNIKPEELEGKQITLKNYVGKKVAISVSHTKDKNNKIQAQIDNFFTADKVPF